MTDYILSAIDEEIAKLREARELLAGSGAASGTKPAKARRTLSLKARRAIAEAQHKRWAKVRSRNTTAAARGVIEESVAT